MFPRGLLSLGGKDYGIVGDHPIGSDVDGEGQGRGWVKGEDYDE